MTKEETTMKIEELMIDLYPEATTEYYAETGNDTGNDWAAGFAAPYDYDAYDLINDCNEYGISLAAYTGYNGLFDLRVDTEERYRTVDPEDAVCIKVAINNAGKAIKTDGTWYAVEYDGYDAHDNGSFDYSEAVEIAEDAYKEGKDNIKIAEIDPKDDYCYDVIKYEDI